MEKKLPDELIRTMTANRMVVFAGAGISKDAPSDLPLAAELQDVIVDALLRRIHPPIGDNERANALRAAVRGTIPESLYQILRDQLGSAALRLLSSALSCGRPNWLHASITRLAADRQVAAVITTNFDLHLETAMAGSRRKVAVLRSDADLERIPRGALPLIKIHGSIDEPDSIITTLQQVGRGLTPPKGKVLKRLLSRDVFLFLGWSDSDIDLSPALMSGGRPFVWIQHGAGWNISAVARARRHGSREPEEISVDALMRAHGGWLIRADTGTAVAALCRALGTPLSRRKPCAASSEWQRRIHAWAERLSSGQRLTAVAGICDRLGYLRDAIRIYGQAEREFQRKGDRASVAGALWDRGVVLTRASRCTRASQSFVRATAMYEELDQPDFAIRVRFDSVVIALREERWDEVIRICRDALRHFRQSGDEGAVAHVCHNLGIAFSRKGHQRRALLLWTISERFHRRLGELRGVAEVFNSIAGYYLRAGSPEEALRYVLRAERLFARFGGEEEQAYVAGRRALVLVKLGRTGEAVTVLGKAVERAARAGNHWLTAALRRHLSQVQGGE